MSPDIEKRKVFIVVRTYPTPARQGVEVSCTAGITEAGKWFRLFPVPYRFLDSERRFKSGHGAESIGPAPAELEPEFASGGFVAPDMAANGLMPDREPAPESESAGNLLGAPLLTQQLEDLLPLLRGESGVASGSGPSRPGAMRRNKRTVAAIEGGRIAPQLA
jgi:hypothetical protein